MNVSFRSELSACSCKEILKKIVQHITALSWLHWRYGRHVTWWPYACDTAIWHHSVCRLFLVTPLRTATLFRTQQCKIGCYKDHVMFSVRYELNLHKFFKIHCSAKSHLLSCDVSVLLPQSRSDTRWGSVWSVECTTLKWCQCVAALAATPRHIVLQLKCPRMCFIRGGKCMCNRYRNLCSIFVWSLTPSVSVLL